MYVNKEVKYVLTNAYNVISYIKLSQNQNTKIDNIVMCFYETKKIEN